MDHLLAKNCDFQEEKPKLCVPLLGKDLAALQQEIDTLELSAVDLLEWRMDHFQGIEQESLLLEAATFLGSKCKDKVLLFTFRTFAQGGNKEFTSEQYTALYEFIIQQDLSDMIDLEYCCGSTMLSDLITHAHQQGIAVLLSHHDLKKTPSLLQIKEQLIAMEEFGVDLVKVAYMPNSLEDVFHLMLASKEAYQELHTSLVSIAMSNIGCVSRVFAQIAHSSITFAAHDAQSAPGQLDYQKLRLMIDTLENV